jgi:hypothetical protein
MIPTCDAEEVCALVPEKAPLARCAPFRTACPRPISTQAQCAVPADSDTAWLVP